MNESITDLTELDRIRHRHTHRYDKWIRMTAGSGSNLISYQSGVLNLELRISRGFLRNKEKLIKAVPHSWLQEPELQHAREFVMHIYETRLCDILLEVVRGRFPEKKEDAL